MKLIRIILIFFVFCHYQVTGHHADSLASHLEEARVSGDFEKLYQLHFQIGKEYYSGEKEDYKKATFHFEEAHRVAKVLQDVTKIAESHMQIGLSHQRQNHFQMALEHFFDIVELEENIHEIPNKAKAFTQISSIYQALGDYEKAFEYQMQALPIHERSNDSLGIAQSNYNIGGIFFYQNHFERALQHYEKAMAIVNALQNERFIYSCLAALGSVHDKLGNHEKSLDFNNRSLILAKKLNYQTGIAYALGNIAMNYLGQKNYRKAEEFLTESISIKMERGDKWGVIGSNIDLAKLFLKWGKAKKAVVVLESALALAIEVDSKTRQPEIYQLLGQAHDDLNLPLEAYRYAKKYIELKDDLLNEKMVEEMGKTKRRYEVEKQEHEIAMLKKENELLGKNEKIQNQQIYIFGITVLLFISGILWYKNKLKYQNSVNHLLEEKNQLLNTKNEEIHIKNKQLEYSNEDLQQFAYVASHDLKEPLRMIHSYSSLLDRRYQSVLDENGKEFLHYIVDAVNRMTVLLDDLLDFSRAGSQVAPTGMISVEDVMVLVEANLRHRIENLNGTLKVESENFPIIRAHRTQLLQLLQNLVSNGLKFKGDEDPIVSIKCVKESNRYVFSVTDNGIGISKSNSEKVFEMFRRLHTREEYEGTGIGLATCKRIVSSWGGDIWVDSVEGEGSTFSFSIPLSMASEKTATQTAEVIA